MTQTEPPMQPQTEPQAPAKRRFENRVQHWVVVDADGRVLGRLASEIAQVLRGKHKRGYAPNLDCGDGVIVVNCEKLRVTGDKLRQKTYIHHTMYPGGLRSVNLATQLAKHPDRVIRSAVRGMLPKTNLGRTCLRRLRVYVGPQHPHAAQRPRPLEKHA